MNMRILLKEDWQRYFDELSKYLSSQVAEIHSRSLGGGDKSSEDWVRLTSLSYDAQADRLVVATPGCEHYFPSPRRISMHEGEHALSSLEIIGAEDELRTLILRDAASLLMLAASLHTAPQYEATSRSLSTDECLKAAGNRAAQDAQDAQESRAPRPSQTEPSFLS